MVKLIKKEEEKEKNKIEEEKQQIIFQDKFKNLEQKIIDIKRVVRVVAGGRRLSFRVCMVVGDKKGSVGVGIGKAPDTSLAISKAFNNACKNMVKINTTDDLSIPHDVKMKYGSSRILLMPNKNRGLVAGSSARTVLLAGGFKNITSKILSGSKNKINIARATFHALLSFENLKNKK